MLSKLTTDTARAMIEALIAGERNPKTLAELAIGKARSKRAELAGALDGDWQPHHGELARILLDQIDALTAQIDALTSRVSELIEQIPAAWGADADGVTGPQAGTGPDAVILPAVARLDEITGCGIIAASASRTHTFLGERYRRLARRRGKRKALAAVARSILVIIFHLLADRTDRFCDLGPDWYDRHIDAQRKTRNLIRQLEALGHTVTLTPADPAAACPLNSLISGQLKSILGWAASRSRTRGHRPNFSPIRTISTADDRATDA